MASAFLFQLHTTRKTIFTKLSILKFYIFHICVKEVMMCLWFGYDLHIAPRAFCFACDRTACCFDFFAIRYCVCAAHIFAWRDVLFGQEKSIKHVHKKHIHNECLSVACCCFNNDDWPLGIKLAIKSFFSLLL